MTSPSRPIVKVLHNGTELVIPFDLLTMKRLEESTGITIWEMGNAFAGDKVSFSLLLKVAVGVIRRKLPDVTEEQVADMVAETGTSEFVLSVGRSLGELCESMVGRGTARAVDENPRQDDGSGPGPSSSSASAPPTLIN